MHKIELVCHKQACLRQTGMTKKSHTEMIIHHARFSRRKIGTGYLTNKIKL
jgi:hypothetical protein